MLFGFRGIRVFQVTAAIAALAMGVGAAFGLKAFADDGTLLGLLLAIVLGALFLWLFATAVRAPTSFVAVADERTRVRFAGFVDTVFANSDIVAVRAVKQPWWGGIGVRGDFRGTVALVSAWGSAAEIELSSPIRVWAIPKVWALRADRLRVSVRNPEKLVERFSRP
jgi:hypothetical protein